VTLFDPWQARITDAPAGSRVSALTYRQAGKMTGASVGVALAQSEPLARQILQVHRWAALLLLALIGLHVGAALRDRFVRHDEALAGLLSAVRRPHRPGTWELSKRRHDKGAQARGFSRQVTKLIQDHQ
jgi:hypothetical protein